jgi:chorismate synthase
MKYGFRDYRGGGRSSGRETIARVAAGAIAKKILYELDVKILTYTLSIADIAIDKAKFDASQIYQNFLAMPDKDAAEKAAAFLTEQKTKEDSAGGVIECIVTGFPSGVGEPVFEKLDAMLGKAIFSIGAVKGVEIGNGFDAACLSGSQNNDFYRYDEAGNLIKQTNNAGGILGGISDGYPIVLRAAFKATPSIHAEQKSVNKQGENIDLRVKGRHDPVIVPRAVIVVESMVALTLVDSLLQRICSRMDLIKKALL